MLKKIKVLLSAYACEPDKGSEPGVGWNWALELTKMEYDVYILTRSKNKKKMDDYFIRNKKPDNLNFFYYDLSISKFLIYLKENIIVVNIYYFLWQMGALKFVRKRHKEIKFDIIQHLTFGVFRHPSFLYRLDVPFVFGPVGGGEDTPAQVRSLIPFKYFFYDLLRTAFNRMSCYNLLLTEMFKHSLVIFTKTQQTKDLIPIKYHSKTINYLEIGITNTTDKKLRDSNEEFNLLYAGRLMYFKGFDLAIPAFAEFTRIYQGNTEFYIIGNGKYKKRITDIALKNNIVSRIKFIEWMNQKELLNFYKKVDVLLFPSFHDSSGNVVLEALSFGLPVVSLDCGGPAAVMGDKLKELTVYTGERSPHEIIQDISRKLKKLATEEKYFNQMSEFSVQRAKELQWNRIVRHAYEIIGEKIIVNGKKT